MPKKKDPPDSDEFGVIDHPTIGHNSEVSGARLKSFVQRIETLEGEKSRAAEDIRDVYQEVKSVGFEPKIIRKIIRLKKMNKEVRQEEQELISLYASAMQLDLGF